MYRVHPLLRTPPDDARLWRYTDLSQFLWLLSKESLYFAKVKEFGDRWEGALPTGSIEAIRRRGDFLRLLESTPEDLALQIYKDGLKSEQGMYGVNCWHLNEVESVAMWKLYTRGNDGVAIQTTVGRLKTCLSREVRDVFITPVNYLDHEAQHTEESVSFDALIPLVTKRRSFGHESEVRVILDRRYDDDRSAETELLSSFVGEIIAVDLPTLIENIVVAPDYPGWAIESLHDLVTRAGLAVKVETSDLLRLPEPNEPEWRLPRS